MVVMVRVVRVKDGEGELRVVRVMVVGECGGGGECDDEGDGGW